jgi:hypothetical protein
MNSASRFPLLSAAFACRHSVARAREERITEREIDRNAFAVDHHRYDAGRLPSRGLIARTVRVTSFRTRTISAANT